MSWGGTRTYKHPLNSMGWANEEQPQTSKESRDGFFTPAELLHQFGNVSKMSIDIINFMYEYAIIYTIVSLGEGWSINF